MKLLRVLPLLAAFSATFAALDISPAQTARADDAATPAGSCVISGYRRLFQSSTPAYLPGETARQPELGAALSFPLPALGYDPATQRFTIAMPLADEADPPRLIELRRKHVEFDGDACPGQTESGGSIRCFEATTLASRGSNPVYCQKDSTASQ